MATALTGVAPDSVERMIGELGLVKENLRQAIAQRTTADTAGERRYG
jgi:hypothetical protein